MLVPKTYPLLVQCIERGVDYGIARTWKHSKPPSDAALERLKEQVYQAVMNEILEAFDIVREGPGVDAED